ncbi:MAG: hypothetical protein ABUT20_04785 [Bacteroidota bacterium]
MKNFTWKRFGLYILWFFTITLVVALIWNYFDKGETIASLFTTHQLILRSILSVVLGFFSTIFYKKNEIIT